MFYKAFIPLIILAGFTAMAQPPEWKAMYGNWQVEKRLLLDTTFYAASTEGQKEARMENTECLTGVFTFSDSGVTVDKEVCDFENCTTADKAIAMKHFKANKSAKYIHDIPGEEMEEDEVVGDAFLKLIGMPTAKTLTVVEMACDNEEMEGDDLRVCIINHSRVALFYDDNLLLLKKMPKK